MKTDLIFQTIQLHIDLLAAPSASGNSYLTEADRKSIHNNTLDLINDLLDLSALDSASFRSLNDKLSIAYVNGGL